MHFFKQLKETVEKFEKIIIHRHVNPDPDALGAQLGLAQLIRDNFDNKQVYCVGKNNDHLSFIGRMDVIDDDMYDDALVIVVDTANTPRIDDDRYKRGKCIVKIDHHPPVDQYGELVYVDDTASSTCEMIAHLARKQTLHMSDQTARLLYIGIVGDTGRFLYPSTSAQTLDIASYLRDHSFDAFAIHDKMMTMSAPIAQLYGYVMQHLTINAYGVASIVLSQDLLTEYGLTDADTAAIVSVPSLIDSVVCWGIFVEQPHGKYRCRLRSKGPVINGIASRHDGGGHPLASGANASDRFEIDLIIDEMTQASKLYQKECLYHDNE